MPYVVGAVVVLTIGDPTRGVSDRPVAVRRGQDTTRVFAEVLAIVGYVIAVHVGVTVY
jgi:hypothetical protein